MAWHQHCGASEAADDAQSVDVWMLELVGVLVAEA